MTIKVCYKNYPASFNFWYESLSNPVNITIYPKTQSLPFRLSLKQKHELPGIA